MIPGSDLKNPFPACPILVFGGGGHGKAIIDLLRALQTYDLVGIIDDGIPPGSLVMGVPVLGGADVLSEWRSRGVTLAVNAVGGIGNVAARLQVFDLLSAAGFTCPQIVHPQAMIEPSASLEEGVQVLARAYIGSDVRIGFGSLVNVGAILSHDCILGRVVNISPGAMLAGGVRVDDHAQIGMGVTINVNLTVGSGARVGNGATVKADVPPGGRVFAGATYPEPRLKPPVESV